MNLGEFRKLTHDLPDIVPLMYHASDEKGRCCWSAYSDVLVTLNPYDKDDVVVLLNPGDD